MKKEKQNINTIELLNIYYDEWKYRLDRFRKQMAQSFIVIFFVITLPISISFFNPNIGFVFKFCLFILLSFRIIQNSNIKE